MKIPKAKQLPSGSWRIQLRVGDRRISVTESTEKACIARAMALQQELIQPVDRSTLTLTTAIDHYIDARQNILSPSSLRSYRTIQRNRFQTAMHTQLRSLSDRDWQKLVNQEARLCAGKTLKTAWGFVSSVIYEETGRKVSVSLPQVVSDPRQFLDPDQIKTFLEAAHGSAYEIPALLALCSLRVSELSALTWEQIDLKSNLIHVRGAVVPDENHHYVMKRENKNSTSRRDVPIMIPRLADLLAAADRKQDRVVTLHPSTICNGINKICASAGIPQVGTHGLRHSFASLAYHLNMPEKVAMQIGGWSNDATMRKIYTHVSQKDVLTYQNAMTDFYQNSV